MKKNYYRIAIERYFSTPVPYCLFATVPMLLYGYYESDLWFWVGLALTVAVFAVNHLMMHSLTSTFGLYATKKQVDYVSNFLMGDCKVFSEQESSLEGIFWEQASTVKIVKTILLVTPATNIPTIL